MANEDPRIAPLRRKLEATQEPAKRNELAVVLRGLGFDPDAVETVSAAPKGRSEPKLQTTEDKRTAPDTKSRPARPAATKPTTKAAPKTAAKDDK